MLYFTRTHSTEVGHLRDNGAFKRHLSQLQVNIHFHILWFISTPFLQTGLRYVFDGVILRNNEAMEALLHSSIELAIGKVVLVS